MATTVADAVEELAGIIKLSVYSTFTLFECRKVANNSKAAEMGNEEFIALDDNKYIGDILAEFKAAKGRSKWEILQCKLTFKKWLFPESDEAVTDPVFIQLSYVQLQHDYILGSYPVGHDGAAQLCALQILVEIGYVEHPESCVDWTSYLERYLPGQIAVTRTKRDWELEIMFRFLQMEHMSKDEARQQFRRMLKILPYGNSIFFSARKIDDPIGLLPGWIILGINKRGLISTSFKRNSQSVTNNSNSNAINEAMTSIQAEREKREIEMIKIKEERRKMEMEMTKIKEEREKMERERVERLEVEKKREEDMIKINDRMAQLENLLLSKV